MIRVSNYHASETFETFTDALARIAAGVDGFEAFDVSGSGICGRIGVTPAGARALLAREAEAERARRILSNLERSTAGR